MSENILGFLMLVIYVGVLLDLVIGVCVILIYQILLFVFDDVDYVVFLFGLQVFGNIYIWIINLIIVVLEECVVVFEGGMVVLVIVFGYFVQFLCFYMLMQLGDNIVVVNKFYGGLINQLNYFFKSFGWGVKWVDLVDMVFFEVVIDDNIWVIFIESFVNLGGIIVDIEVIFNIVKIKGILLVVDNMMVIFYLCCLIEYGVDIVFYLLIKFMGGYGNFMGGIIVDGGLFDWLVFGKYLLLLQLCLEY